MQPITCNLNGIPAEERELHGQRWQQLMETRTNLAVHGEGYALTFPIHNETLALLMRVVANERLCCPFLHFTIEIASASEDMILTLTGPEGTKALLEHELGLLA